MDPEAMKPVRPRSFPRDRSDLTARVAHTMKPIFPPQFPSAKLSTPCTGRPRHEAAAVVSVARSADTNLTARGSRRRAALPPGFPSKRTTQPHGAPEQQSHYATRFPERRSSPSCTGRLYAGANADASVARNSDARPTAQVARAIGPRSPHGYPCDDAWPHCADPDVKPAPSHGYPRDDSDLTARMPMLEALASRSFPREAFPRRAVTCGTGGLRCDVLPA